MKYPILQNCFQLLLSYQKVIVITDTRKKLRVNLFFLLLKTRSTVCQLFRYFLPIQLRSCLKLESIPQLFQAHIFKEHLCHHRFS